MNRYGITVDTSKTEIEQIAQLRLEHIRQYPSIVMKNPDFKYLHDFIIQHQLNKNDAMQNAPDKIKVLNVMKNVSGFEYANTVINCYLIEYNSFKLSPYDFIKWLIDNFPKNFDWSIKQCKNPAVLNYIYEQTNWMKSPFNDPDKSKYTFDLKSIQEIQNKTLIYCILNNITEFPKCKTCNKIIVTNVLSVFEGFRQHCNFSCGMLDPDVKSKYESSCLTNFGSKTYLGSAEGIKIKKQRIKQLYGKDHYSSTNEWKNKVRQKSLDEYGVEWPSQRQDVKKHLSERQKISAKERTAKSEKTKREKRNRKYWTDDEIRRISEGNKTEKNQLKRLERAKKRRIKYYNEKLCTNEYVRPLFSLETYLSIPVKKIPTTDLMRECQECGTVFDNPLDVFYIGNKEHKTYSRCPHCYPNRKKSSFEEYQVKEFLKSEISHDFELIHGQYENFKTIRPFQLDIIVKEKTNGKILFAVEFDGVKWHSMEQSNNINKQLRKTIKCKELGIPLVHIFEDEWLYNREKTENLLKLYASGHFRNLNFNKDTIVLDRSKFCKAVKIDGYELVSETEPKIIERKGLACFGQNLYRMPDCGELHYKRVN